MDQDHAFWDFDGTLVLARRHIIAQALALALTDIIDRQDAQFLRVIVFAEGHAAATQAMMLNHLLHLELDLGAIGALRGYVALHEGAVEAQGDPGVRVDVVSHAGDVLAGVVAVAVRDGVHVVAEGVHDAVLGGTDAHDGTALAVEAHVQLVWGQGGRVCGGCAGCAYEVEAVCFVGCSPGRGVECGGYGYAVVCDVADTATKLVVREAIGWNNVHGRGCRLSFPGQVSANVKGRSFGCTIVCDAAHTPATS